MIGQLACRVRKEYLYWVLLECFKICLNDCTCLSKHLLSVWFGSVSCIVIILECIFFISTVKKKKNGKISAQPHSTLCIQFLDRENNDKNNRLPLGKQICFKIVWGCVEILPQLHRYRSYIVTDR